MRTCLLAALLSCSAQAFAALPPNASIRSLISSSSGTLYAAGAIGQTGFIAQLPDGFLFSTSDPVDKLAISAYGSIYAAGTRLPSTNNPPRAFVLKLEPTGQLGYLRVLDGPVSYADGIAVNAAGEALISGHFNGLDGIAAFPVTPNSVAPKSKAFVPGFLIKLDAKGEAIHLAVLGFGGGPVAFDTNGNIYATGVIEPLADISPTQGALQPNHLLQACGGTAQVGQICFYQYVVKIAPDGTKLLYSTFLTGDYGSQPSSISVDSEGSAIIAGTTASRNYPVTPGAYQQTNSAAIPAPPILLRPTAGVLSKLNSSGTALIWSTYFGGTGLETISDAKIDQQGNVLFTGLTASADLPGSSQSPNACMPSYDRQQLYAAKLSADGRTLTGSAYLFTSDRTPPRIAANFDGSAAVEAGNIVTSFFLDGPMPTACFTDSADFAIVDRVSPGQLVTLFTANGTTTPFISTNEIASQILYAGPGQTNFQVPLQVAGRDNVTLNAQISGSQFTRVLALLPASPSAFLYFSSCETLALARNPDHSFNSCRNPAPYGSVVTFYLNGVGAGTPTITLADNVTGAIISAGQDPDSPQGVWSVQILITPALKNVPDFFQFVVPYELLIDGNPLRDGNLRIYSRGALHL